MNWKNISKYLVLLLLSISGFLLFSLLRFENGQGHFKISLASLKPETVTAETLPQHSKIQAYFNYNPNNTYTDLYRQINRQGDNLDKVIIDQIASATQTIDLAVEEVNLPKIAQTIAERNSPIRSMKAL